MENLTLDELISIDGGKSFWYYFGKTAKERCIEMANEALAGSNCD